MWQVNEEDGAEHYHCQRGSADTGEESKQNGQAAKKLRDSNQIADKNRRVKHQGELCGSRAAKCAKQDDASVIEKRDAAGNANQEKGRVRAGCGCHGS